MKEILFFSNNKNKVREISILLQDISFKLLSLNDFKKIKSPKEIGKSFKENAKIKSFFGLKKFKRICFADDSGICINSMGGKPGINSKGFLNNSQNMSQTLNEIIFIAKHKNDYSAFFQTSISLSINKDKHIFFNGKIKGRISKKICGSGGFGYDPIFIPEGYKKTFAEMKISEKNKISHRAIAISKLKKYLISI